MAVIQDPKLPQRISVFTRITASVSSEASALAISNGGFAGLFFNTTASTNSVTIVGDNGVSVTVTDVVRNTTIWMKGAYVAAMAASMSAYAVV